jgi:hypothetical protein
VDGASLPRAAELPASLARLARHQALGLSPSSFDFDTDRLFKVLDRTLAELRTQRDAASMQEPAEEAPALSTTGVHEAPEPREQVEPIQTPRIPPATPAAPPTARPVAEQSKPPASSTTEVREAREPRMSSSAALSAWRIYISYRRQDTALLASRVYDRLIRHFGNAQVFMDVDSIELGDDFAEVIRRAVTSCDVLLALIGREWLGASDWEGRRRLDDTDDFVRMEIEAALERGIPVIPVLSEGARMPHEIELPQSLAPLSNCNAIEVTHIRFSEDVDQLIGVVGGALRSHKEERPERPSRPVQPSYRFEDSHQVMVFLCHASSDKPTVRTLRSRLLGDGIQPWLDEEDILPGQKWEVAIQKAIRSSDIILVCLSKTSINKVGYLQREISEVLQVADEQPEDSVFVIPARLEPCDVPERFRRWQWVDLFEELGYDRLMRTLRVAGSGELRK